MKTDHPEIREGEVFITNYCPCEAISDDGYRDIRWKTKRAGTVAHDRQGKVIPDVYPVFIQLSEYEEVWGEVIINDTK